MSRNETGFGMSSDLRKRSLNKFITSSRRRLIAILVVGLVLISIGLFAWVGSPSRKTYHVRISGGHAGLNRHKVAQYLKRHSNELNLDVEVIPAQVNTPEAVRMVQSGEIDLALVNGLFRFPDADNVRQVATITFESVHLLVKEEFAEQVSADYGSLKGMSFNIGPDASETALLSRAMLTFLGLNSADGTDTGVTLTRLTIDELLTQVHSLKTESKENTSLLRADLPDAVFHESILPSSFAEQLVRNGRYQVVPLRFAQAFSQISVEEEDLDEDHIDQIHIESRVIPAYTYGVSPPVPAEECPTLGTPLILIAHKDVPNAVLSRLLPRIYSGPVERLYQPPKLSELSPTFPLHSAAVEFRDRDKPVVWSDLVDAIREFASGLAPMFGGILALFGYYRWRQVLRFLEYYRRLQELDLMVKGTLTIPELPPPGPERVKYLENELDDLQQKAIDSFCRNYFYGEGVLENFLSAMSESRDVLRRAK